MLRPDQSFRRELLFPGLDEFVIADGHRLFVLIVELGIGSTWLAQPVVRILLVIHDRSEITLNSGTLQTLKHTFLVFAERIEGFLRRF